MKHDFALHIATTVTEKPTGEKEHIRLMLDVTEGKHSFLILDVYGDVIFKRANYKAVADRFWAMEIK